MIAVNDLETRILKEIINEFTVRQKVQITFMEVKLNELSGNKYNGTVKCSDPSRSWEINMEAEQNDATIRWNLSDTGWYWFDSDEENKPFRKLLEEAGALKAEGKFREALERYIRLEQSGNELKNADLLLQGILDQGLVLLDDMGQNEEAAGKFREYVDLSKQLNNITHLATGLLGLAISLANMGTRFGDSLDAWEELEKLVQKEENKNILLKALKNQAQIYFSHALNYEKALEKLAIHEKISREINDKDHLEFSLELQAKCHLKLGNYNTAYTKYDELISFCKEHGKISKYIYCLVEQGYILAVHREDYKGALLKYEDAETMCLAINDKQNLKTSLQSQSYLLRHKLGGYQEALKKYVEFEVLCREFGDKPQLAISLQNQAWILLEKSGDYETAYKKSQELEKLSRETGDQENLKMSLQYQYTILKAWGDKQAAKEVKKELKSL
jgi:tetratricopeptide (TPR) repeat protein